MRKLETYKKRRKFNQTPEPKGTAKSKSAGRWTHPWFVVQEHHASHLHYDFRLEWKGVLKSWAVPKGPPLNPSIKRLAVEVEDHPLEYAKFEGEIPKGNYGAGQVILWDKGQWTPPKNADQDFKKGHIEFQLKGHKLNGRFRLIRMKGAENGKANWIFMKQGKGGSRPSLTFTPPQLARLDTRPPEGDEWRHEIKFDGYRMQALMENGEVKLISRNGKDWTDRFKDVVAKLSIRPDESLQLDGEIVWQGPDGKIDFQRLQNSLETDKQDQLVYYVFDVLFENGIDLKPLALKERQKILKRWMRRLANKRVRLSETFSVPGRDLLASCCKMGLEGIVSKRTDSPYTSGRPDSWRKVKCQSRQEFVVGGFTAPKGSREGLGALLLGVWKGNKFHHVGRVGTGFSLSELANTRRMLARLRSKNSPFHSDSPKGADITWVKPKLVAEVSFANWTESGKIRAPVFHGFRSDKSANEITHETPSLPSRLTNPDKIFFAKEKITKAQVEHYYQTVAEWILPHIDERPLSIVRCPNGTGKPCFFQKHKPDKQTMPLASDDEALYINDRSDLHEFNQLGGIELHSWNCRRTSKENPDQFILDLDPAPDLSWPSVLEAAKLVRSLLDQLKLKSFIKLTGGKGLHIHVPIRANYSWHLIRAFTETLARQLCEQHPTVFLANMNKSLRKGKIYLDYLRNGRGSTAIAPYALRARPISSVAMPLSWDEILVCKKSNAFTLSAALSHLEGRRKDPWSEYFRSPRAIPMLDKIGE